MKKSLEKDLAQERRFRAYSQVVTSLAGILVAFAALAWIIFERNYSATSVAETTKNVIISIQILNDRINELARKVEALEKIIQESRPETSFTPIQDEKREFDPTLGLEGEDEPAKGSRLTFREYILPSIYLTLGSLLLISALVALATGQAARKETAVELTKTLMTFFIGAATGQV